LNDFNRSMYAQMIRLSLNPNVGKVSNSLLKSDSVYRSKSEIELVLIGFEFLFIKKKQVSAIYFILFYFILFYFILFYFSIFECF